MSDKLTQTRSGPFQSKSISLHKTVFFVFNFIYFYTIVRLLIDQNQFKDGTSGLCLIFFPPLANKAPSQLTFITENHSSV